MNALEDYLSNGGTLDAIQQISISSPPCKYCHLILSDLGIRNKVVAPGDGYGSCQGGSYGWFWSGGQISLAAQKKTGKSEKQFIDSVVERQRKL